MSNIERGRGTKDNVSALSSYIANAHDELYAFIWEKWLMLKKIQSQQEGTAAPNWPPLNPSLDMTLSLADKKQVYTDTACQKKLDK